MIIFLEPFGTYWKIILAKYLANIIHCSQTSQLWSGSMGFSAESNWTQICHMHAWQRVLDPNCNCNCTIAPGVPHLQLMFTQLQQVSQLVLQHCNLSVKICKWGCTLHTPVLYQCTEHTGAVPLYCTHKCCTTVLHTQVQYHCNAHTGAVPLYRTHRCCTTTAHTGAAPLYCTHKCCTTVLHTQVLYHCTAHTGAVPLYCTPRYCTTVLHTKVLYHCAARTWAVPLYCAQWRMEPPLGCWPWDPLRDPSTTVTLWVLHTLSPIWGVPPKVSPCNTLQMSFGAKILHTTQFEIERRSYGQSMTYFRFFSCGGQTNFTGFHSFFLCAL